MSKARVLWWNGSNGLAISDGVHCELRSAPRVAGLQIDEIDYAPAVRLLSVQEVGQNWRAITRDESVQIDAALLRMVEAVRGVFT
jgi:hypothetical protein